MARLILVRHGESEGNASRIFATDPVGLPLTELGRVQAHEAAARIRARFRPTRVITSHYDRARDTGEIIAAELKLPLSIDYRLHERDMGRMRGRPYGVMQGEAGFDPGRYWLWKPPGGESLEEVQSRVSAAVDRLAAENPTDDLVIVSHGGVMVALWAYATGRWEGAPITPNCGIVVIERAADRYLAPQVLAD